jgi:serine/threonine protein kinase
MFKLITQKFQRDPIMDRGYIIDRNKMLGFGTFGKVFLCKTNDGNTYAIKEIKWTGERKDYDNIMREKNNWLLLDDPHIVKLIDFFEGSHFRDGTAYFYQIMEKCETDLSRWLLINNNRSIETSDKMIKQIIEGLKFIHKLKIIHRDLKPQNILITVNGTCKIADFGDIVNHIKTQTNAHTQGVGTLLYAAPEQLESSKYNLKVDIYSLGIIIMEFYTLFGDYKERNNEIENLRRGIIPLKFYDNYDKESVRYINLKYLIFKMTDTDPIERPTIEELINRICE